MFTFFVSVAAAIYRELTGPDPIHQKMVKDLERDMEKSRRETEQMFKDLAGMDQAMSDDPRVREVQEEMDKLMGGAMGQRIAKDAAVSFSKEHRLGASETPGIWEVIAIGPMGVHPDSFLHYSKGEVYVGRLREAQGGLYVPMTFDGKELGPPSGEDLAVKVVKDWYLMRDHQPRWFATAVSLGAIPIEQGEHNFWSVELLDGRWISDSDTEEGFLMTGSGEDEEGLIPESDLVGWIRRTSPLRIFTPPSARVPAGATFDGAGPEGIEALLDAADAAGAGWTASFGDREMSWSEIEALVHHRTEGKMVYWGLRAPWLAPVEG